MYLKHLPLAILLLTAATACRKMATDEEQPAPKTSRGWSGVTIPAGFFKTAPVPGVATGQAQPNGKLASRNATDSTPDPDNGDEPIVLGQQLNNPYTVGNMQQAYYNLYGNSNGVQATHLYVRFKPANVEQLQTLLSDDNLELQDYPMDYEVVQDGDYWQDPALGTEEIGWLYTAVPVGYTPPAGITYQQLEQLHIPNDNLLVEQMAESQAAGAVYRSSTTADKHTVERTDVQGIGPIITPTLLPGNCAETPCLAGCQPIENPNPPDCSGGPGDNGGNTYPPDSKRPRGLIRVQDIVTCNVAPTNVPLRQARVVCKRWFKIYRSYTTDQGEFVSAKRYNNRVKIIYKTKNDIARVSKIRGVRLWQLFFPVKKRIGIFDEGTMNLVDHIVTRPNPASASNKELPYWVAATTHNTILEYRQYAAELGVALPRLTCIYLFPTGQTLVLEL